MSTVISVLGVNIAHTSPWKMIRFGFWITLWFDWNVIGLIPIIHMCVHVGIVVDHNQIYTWLGYVAIHSVNWIGVCPEDSADYVASILIGSCFCIFCILNDFIEACHTVATFVFR